MVGEEARNGEPEDERRAREEQRLAQRIEPIRGRQDKGSPARSFREAMPWLMYYGALGVVVQLLHNYFNR